jgi:hypothetical protein
MRESRKQPKQKNDKKIHQDYQKNEIRNPNENNWHGREDRDHKNRHGGCGSCGC